MAPPTAARCSTACARLGITLLHAKPYDAPARGKMERFWRTLREGCLDYLGDVASLARRQRRLAGLPRRALPRAPARGLLGKSPAKVYATARRRRALDEAALRDALTERTRRRVSTDNVISIDGVAWELDQGFLAGQLVTVARCLVKPDEPPWVEHEGKRLVLRAVDPVKNARRKRPPRVADATAHASYGLRPDEGAPPRSEEGRPELGGGAP